MQRVGVLLAITGVVILSGCEQKAKQPSNDGSSHVATHTLPKQAQADDPTRPQHSPLAHGHQDEGLLRRMGITKQGSRIIIDFNRSEAYMRKLTDQMRKQAHSVQAQLKSIAQEVNRSVRFDNETVTIDVGKVHRSLKDLETKSRSWMERMQTIVQEAQKEFNLSR